MNSAQVMFALTKRGGPFPIRQYFCVVPNVSWGLLHWEADLCVVTKAKKLWECEIKVSASDWKIDADKSKWRLFKDKERLKHFVYPSRFYYAAPQALAARWAEFNIPDFAGVISVNESGTDLKAEVIRPCKEFRDARKLTDDEMMQVARLGSMRFWGENHKRIQAVKP